MSSSSSNGSHHHTQQQEQGKPTAEHSRRGAVLASGAKRTQEEASEATHISIYEVNSTFCSETGEKVVLSPRYGDDVTTPSFRRILRSRKFSKWLREKHQQQQKRTGAQIHGYTPTEAVKRARKLEKCGAWSAWLSVPSEGIRQLEKATFCKQPLLCPFCAAGRSVRHALAASEKVVQVLRERPDMYPYLLTLTVKADTDLARQQKTLFDALERCRRSQRYGSAWKHLAGGYLSAECKRAEGTRGGKNLWHFHAHAVVLAHHGRVGHQGHSIFWRDGEDESHKGYARGPLADQWSKALGYPANCDLRPLFNYRDLGPLRQVPKCKQKHADIVLNAVGADLMEVFKYALKMSGLSFDDQWEAFQTLNRRRLIRNWGLLRGLKMPDDFGPDTSPLMGKAYQRELYRWSVQDYGPVLISREEGEDYDGNHFALLPPIGYNSSGVARCYSQAPSTEGSTDGDKRE